MTSISGTGGGSSSLIQMLQQRFKEADSDGDNALSLDEFKAAGPQGANGPPPAQASGAAEFFAKLDSDSDGQVSKDEFTTGFSKIGSEAKSTLLDAQELFANADSNGDRALSEDEFAAALEKQTASSSGEDTQLLNLLKQASDLYASLTAKNTGASSMAVSA